MRVVVGSDHAGVALKAELVEHLRAGGHEVIDVGTHDERSVDYPAYGVKIGEAVAAGEGELGIAICGTGLGIAMAANKVPGIRAGACSEPFSARMARQHNDANVLAIGARVVAPSYAAMIVDEFLAASFLGGDQPRHLRRIEQLAALDRGERLPE